MQNFNNNIQYGISDYLEDFRSKITRNRRIYVHIHARIIFMTYEEYLVCVDSSHKLLLHR